jgi:Family of unknown function (DUF5706)
VKFADAKAAAVLTLDGIIATVLVTKFANTSFSNLNPAIPVSLALTAISLIISAVACMLGLLPRLHVGNPNNLIYFTRIADFKDATQFLAAVHAASRTDAYEVELAKEIWVRSLVAQTQVRPNKVVNRSAVVRSFRRRATRIAADRHIIVVALGGQFS